MTTNLENHSTSLLTSPLTGVAGASAWCNVSAVPTRAESTSNVVNSVSALGLYANGGSDG